ncbi:hypothetical protein VULLAG_LOCUS13644 [Vulpes lagopus]
MWFHAAEVGNPRPLSHHVVSQVTEGSSKPASSLQPPASPPRRASPGLSPVLLGRSSQGKTRETPSSSDHLPKCKYPSRQFPTRQTQILPLFKYFGSGFLSLNFILFHICF